MPHLKNSLSLEHELGTIKLVELWLKQKKIEYDDDMIETWLNINHLRNMEPTHSRISGAELKRIYAFFGVKMSVNQNYSILWDWMLDKFRISLEKWLALLEAQAHK